MSERTVGDYRLLQPMTGFGSDHRLYLAQHREDPPDCEALYLVKMLEIGSSAHQQLRLAQFRHEAFLLKHFCHECIPTLHESGETQGVAYMVLDYIPGRNLAELLGHRSGSLRAVSHELAVYLMAQVASALHHVHRFEYSDAQNNDRILEVLHRDVSPANILVSRYGDVYLLDFGSASSPYQPPEIRELEPGTLAYKAPERLTLHGKASVQSDLYALAVLLWELLRGERCFGPGDHTQVTQAILSFDLQKKDRKVPGLSAKLSEVLRKNLDRDPKRRFASAFHVLSRLAQSPEASHAARAKAAWANLVRELHDAPGPSSAPLTALP